MSLSNALSKLGIGKHKKSRSTSSSISNPSSPRQSIDQAQAQASSPVNRTRQSIDTPSPRTPTTGSSTGYSRLQQQQQQSQQAGGIVAGKETSHSPVFKDERDRPELPTTISNVNNPIPSPNTNNDASTTYQSKTLPTIPDTDTRTPQSEKRDTFGPTTIIPNTPPRLPEIPKTQPLHHVDSLDRSELINQSQERPVPVIANSSPAGQSVDGKRFASVQSGSGFGVDSSAGSGSGIGGSPLKKDPRIIDGLNVIAGPSATPTSTTNPAQNQTQTSNTSTSTSSNTAQTPTKLPAREFLKSSRDPNLTPETHILSHLANLSLHPYPSTTQSHIPLSSMNLTPGSDLTTQRNDLVHSIVSDAHGREGKRDKLSEFGKNVFEKAGMGGLVGQKGSVEVHTKWFEPVVQVRSLIWNHCHLNLCAYIGCVVLRVHAWLRVSRAVGLGEV